MYKRRWMLSESTLFFLIFIFALFYFTIMYWFCHTLTWIHHGCTCIPKYEPPSHLPTHNISLGHPLAPAQSILYPASDIDWQFVSYKIVYMFQCHSPKSSHPLPLKPVTDQTISDSWRIGHALTTMYELGNPPDYQRTGFHEKSW